MSDFLLKPGNFGYCVFKLWMLFRYSVLAYLLRHCSGSKRGATTLSLPGRCGSPGSLLRHCWHAMGRVSSWLSGRGWEFRLPTQPSWTPPLQEGGGVTLWGQWGWKSTLHTLPLLVGPHFIFCGVWLEQNGYYLIATFSSTKSWVCEVKSKPRVLSTASLLCCQGPQRLPSSLLLLESSYVYR